MFAQHAVGQRLGKGEIARVREAGMGKGIVKTLAGKHAQHGARSDRAAAGGNAGRVIQSIVR